MLEAAEKTPDSKGKDNKQPESNEHLRQSDKELSKTLREIEAKSRSDKSAEPTTAKQFQEAINALTLAVEAKDLSGRQKALIDLVKLESKSKAAGQAIEAFGTKSEDGVDQLRRRQVDFARAAAVKGDDGVMSIASVSLRKLLDGKGPDEPQKRADETLDLGVATYSLTSNKHSNLLLMGQTVSLAKDFRGALSGEPMDKALARESLDILFALSNINPYAKQFLKDLRITDEASLKRYKDYLDQNGVKGGLLNSLINPIKALDNSLFDALKSYESSKSTDTKPQDSKTQDGKPEAKSSKERAEISLTAVDLALCDLATPNGMRDLLKALRQDKNDALAKSLFGESGLPANLKTFVEAANAGKPVNEEQAKAKFAEALINRHGQLEKLVPAASRPDFPNLEESITKLQTSIVAQKKLEQAQTSAGQPAPTGDGGTKPGTVKTDDKAPKPVEKPKGGETTPEVDKKVANLARLELQLIGIAGADGTKDLIKKLAADKDGTIAKELFGEKGIPDNLRPYLQFAYNGLQFSNINAQAAFARALIAHREELQKQVPESKRIKLDHLEPIVDSLKELIKAVDKAEISRLESNKALKKHADDLKDPSKAPPSLPPLESYDPSKPLPPGGFRQSNSGTFGRPGDSQTGGTTGDTKPKTPDLVKPEEKLAAPDAKDAGKDGPEVKNLDKLLRSESSLETMKLCVRDVNKFITLQNDAAIAKDKNAPTKPAIDGTKMEAEWARKEFGPESRRFWSELKSYLELNTMVKTVALKEAGLNRPVGSSQAPLKSETGSTLPETDEMFASRIAVDLQNGKTFDIGFKHLKPGELPSDQDIVKFLNTVGYLRLSDRKLADAAEQSRSVFVDQLLKDNAYLSTEGNLDRFKRPADLPKEREAYYYQWAMDRIAELKETEDAAKKIGAFYAATKTNGKDWIQLQDAFRWFNDVKGEKLTFDNEGIRDGIFPGKIKTNPDGSVAEVKIDTTDRKKLVEWYEKYGKKVEQVSQEIAAAQRDHNKLIHLQIVGDVAPAKVDADKVNDFKVKNKLAGNDSDIGKRVEFAGSNLWQISSLRSDGGYDLTPASPGKQDKDGKTETSDKPKKYNMTKSGIVVSEACNAQGQPDPNGQYLNIEVYKDYYNKSVLALYDREVIPGSVTKVERETLRKETVHKDAFLLIQDNGRPRLAQVQTIAALQKVQEQSKVAEDLAAAAADLAIFASGAGEFRAAQLAAKASGASMWRAGLAGARQGAFNLTLATMGPGKEMIQQWGGEKGYEAMHYRHLAIVVTMTASLSPTLKAATIDKLNKVILRVPYEAEVVGKYLETPVKAANLLSKPWKEGALIDQALIRSHKIMDGYSVGHKLPAPIKWVVPKLGVMPMVDGYFIAQFSDVLASHVQRGQAQDKLDKANEKGLKAPDRSEFFSVKENKLSDADIKRAVELTAKNWSDKLTAAQKERGPGAEQIDKAVKEAAALPADHADRKKCYEILLETYAGVNERSTRGEKLAAARGLLELSEANADLLGAVTKKSNGQRVELRRSELQNFTANDGAVARSLLRRTYELNILDPKDAKAIEANQTALKFFQDTKTPDHDRVAAANLLLTGAALHMNDKVGGSSTVKVKDLVAYLKDRAENSDSLNVRMVAGENLLRIHRFADAALTAQEEKLATAIENKTKSPKDDNLQTEWANASIARDQSKEFVDKLDFNHANFVALCMHVVKSPDASLDLKMQAIASPVGPGLSLLHDQLKYEVEPALLSDSRRADSRAPHVLAGLWGNDSHSIEKFLREVASDPKQNADLRAVAAQALANDKAPRRTVEEVGLTPGLEYSIGSASSVPVRGPAVAAKHAAIKTDMDGRMLVRDLGSAQGTTIIRDDKEIKVTGAWTELKTTDRLVLGNRANGTEVKLASERFYGLAGMVSQIQSNADTPGALSEQYISNLKETLKAPVMEPKSQPIKEHEQLIEKFRAAMSARDLGASAFGMTDAEHSEMIARALVQCVQKHTPQVAAAALAELTPEMLKALPPAQVDALRERVLKDVISVALNNEMQVTMRLSLIGAMPTIFADATTMQKRRAAGMMESMILPGADKVNKGLEASAKDKFDYLYPEVCGPELRELALKSLASMDLNKASDVSKLLLSGGTYNGKTLAPDAAQLRIAALDVLEKARPNEFHVIAMQALRRETDPAVAAKLWNVEFGSRRPDHDEGRMNIEREALEQKLKGRARPSLADDAAKAYNEYRPDITKMWDRLSLLQRVAAGPPDSVEAQRARLALIHVATTQKGWSETAANALYHQATWVQGKKLGAEMIGPLEYALLSNPTATAYARMNLLNAYLHVGAGENGIVSKPELAIVLTKVLENEQSQMANLKDPKSLDYRTSLDFQRELLRELKNLQSELIVPKLVAISKTHPDASIRQEAGRIANINRDTTLLGRQLADSDLRVLQAKSKTDPGVADLIGPSAKAALLADRMTETLADPQADSRAVVRALHLGMISKPQFDNSDDPRLTVLKIAIADKSDSVRLEAAALLSNSPVALDRGLAYKTVADVAKNSALEGARTEANWILEQARRDTRVAQIVDKALAETPSAPRTEAGRADATFLNNPKAQRSFEDLKRRLTDGHQESITWKYDDWDKFCKEAGVPLLSGSGLRAAQKEAAAQKDRNRGSLTNFLTTENTRKKERKDAEELVLQQIPAQINDLMAAATNPDVSTPKLRQALAYVAMTNAELVDPMYKQEVHRRSIDAISKICTGNHPGRGELEWVLKSLLTNKPDLKPEYRQQLLAGLDAMTGDKGTISKENGTGTVALALEQEVRYGNPTDRKCIDYQHSLLDYLGKHGNQDLAPALESFYKNYPNKEIQDKAAAVLSVIKQRQSSETETLVAKMTADLDQARTFSATGTASDKRIAGLKAFMNDAAKTPEQRLRAAEIIIYPGYHGVSDADRRAAAAVYAAIGLSLENNDQKRYETADRILDGTNLLFTDEDRRKARETLGKLIMSKDATIKNKAFLLRAKVPN